MKYLDKRATIEPATQQGALVEVRGASGRLYGLLDPQALTIEFRTGRAGRHTERQTEVIDLKPYLQAVKG